MLPTEKRIQTKGQLKDWIECETAKYGQGGRGGGTLYSPFCKSSVCVITVYFCDIVSSI